MPTTTTRLALSKPLGTETVDIAVLNANADKLDAAAGATICTSTTRPSSPYSGQVIYETDTKVHRVRNGSLWDLQTGLAPIVASSTARDAMFPSPVPGNSVWRSDTLQKETYYAASGSPARPAGWYSGQDGGLVPIIPGSVAVGSGSASVSGNGLITFTSAGSLHLNDIFNSSIYSAYKVIVCMFGNSGTDINTRFKDSSGVISTNVYTYMGQFRNGTTKSEYSSTSQTAISGILSTSEKVGTEMIIENTSGKPIIKMASYSGNNTANYYYNIQGMMNHSTICTGFALLPVSGTITGTIQVYGYRN